MGSPGCSLEGLMLKLKLQYFGHLMWRPDSFEKTLMLGKIEGRRRRGRRGWDGWIASLTQWTWVWVNSGSWWWTGRPGVLPFMGLQRVGRDWATELKYLNFQPHRCVPSGSDIKESVRNEGDPGLIPGSGRSPEEGNGNPFQYSCLENSMDGGAWWATVHGAVKCRTHWATSLSLSC